MAEQVLNVPRSVEAETALIGCILVDENLMLEASDILVPNDFYDQKNKLIFRTMVNLSKEGKSIDVMTVVASLQSNNLLEQCGGLEYISSIADYSYSTLNFRSYCDLVSEASIKRVTIQKLNELAQAGYDPSVETEVYINKVEQEVFELSKRRTFDSFKPVTEVYKSVMETIEANAKRTDEVIGLDTGFRELNK